MQLLRVPYQYGFAILNSVDHADLRAPIFFF